LVPDFRTATMRRVHPWVAKPNTPVAPRLLYHQIRLSVTCFRSGGWMSHQRGKDLATLRK
jgi:hypothetical protein